MVLEAPEPSRDLSCVSAPPRRVPTPKSAIARG